MDIGMDTEHRNLMGAVIKKPTGAAVYYIVIKLAFSMVASLDDLKKVCGMLLYVFPSSKVGTFVTMQLSLVAKPTQACCIWERFHGSCTCSKVLLRSQSSLH